MSNTSCAYGITFVASGNLAAVGRQLPAPRWYRHWGRPTVPERRLAFRSARCMRGNWPVWLISSRAPDTQEIDLPANLWLMAAKAPRSYRHSGYAPSLEVCRE